MGKHFVVQYTIRYLKVYQHVYKVPEPTIEVTSSKRAVCKIPQHS